MKQATLPWAAPPAPLASTSDQQQQQPPFDPYHQHQQHLPPPGQPHYTTDVALDPALFDVDTPPLSQSIPQQALEPALFVSSQDEPQQVIDISTPEPLP